MEILSTAACQAALTGHQYATEIQKYIAVANTTVNFICRDNVEGLLVVFLSIFIS